MTSNDYMNDYINVPDPGTISDWTVHALRLHCFPPCLLMILDRQRKLTVIHEGTIMWKMCEITNILLYAFKIVYYFASSVQLMTWILLHVLVFHPLERLRWSLAWISLLPMGLSPSYLFWWQLMWRVTTDVAVSVCGPSGLWPFRFVAIPVCGCFGLWPFRFVAVPVCGRFGLWPFRSVAVPVCGPSGLWPFRFVAIPVCGCFGLWPFRFVAVPVCGRFGLWPFRSVAVPVCGRFCLWLFRSVAVPVCGRSGLWPFRSVAVPVCGRFGLWPFRLWSFRFVAVMTCYRPKIWHGDNIEGLECGYPR